jgi:hypothetical protein
MQSTSPLSAAYLLSTGGVSASPGGGLSAALLGDAGEGLPQGFAQLLADFGAGGEGLPQGFAQGQLLPSLASAALTAQEVPQAVLPTDADPSAIFALAVSPEEAQAVLARVDQFLKGRPEDAGLQPLRQLRDQLQRAVHEGKPTTVGQLLEPVRLTPESKISLSAMVALLAPRRAEKTALPTAISEEEEVPSPMSAWMQGLQASMFRADDGTSARAQTGETQQAPASDTDERELGTVLQWTPVALQQVVVLPMPPSNAAASPAFTASGVIAPRPDLNEAIPPLTQMPAFAAENLPGQASAEAMALPEIDLPSLDVSALRPRASAGEAPAATAQTPEAANRAAAVAQAMPAATAIPALEKTESMLRDVLSPASAEGAQATFTGSEKSTPPGAPQAPLPPTTATAAPHATQMAAAHHAAATTHASLVSAQAWMGSTPATEQVQVAIQKAVHDGSSKMTIQLDPVDLGRVEVNVQTTRDGQTQIYFVIDKPETFDSLSRDARVLERSLQEAGIKADTGSMQFNLRQQTPQQAGADGQSQQHSGQSQQGEGEAHRGAPIADAEAAAEELRARTVYNYTLNLREGVDISA